MTAQTQRVGVLGGTFDPVHEGHLSLAAACLRALALDQVRLVTNRVAPHKAVPVASEVHRHAMVALATAGEPALVADPRELEREGTSYTVLTLEDLRRERPDAELYFLAGADSLRDLPSWHRWEDVLALATFVVVNRSSLDGRALREAVPAGARERITLLDHEPPPWSATSIRAALARGDVPRGALPPLVAEYVTKNALYGAAAR